MIGDLIRKIYFRIISVPQTIQIEVTNRCNLNCAMCPREKFELEYQDMDLSIFERILTKFKPNTKIVLTGWGEPLLHPDIFRIIALCKSRGLVTEMTTNGVLITEEAAVKLVESNIDSVSISVDYFHECAQERLRHNCPFIERNIKNLIGARSKQNKPQIILQPTLHKGKENDVFEVIRKGSELKVDEVNIVRLDRRFNIDLGTFSVEEEREIAKKIISLA